MGYIAQKGGRLRSGEEREKCPGASKMETKDENLDTDTMTTMQPIRGVAVTISYTTTSQPSNSAARDTVLATRRYQGAQDLIIHEGAKRVTVGPLGIRYDLALRRRQAILCRLRGWSLDWAARFRNIICRALRHTQFGRWSTIRTQGKKATTGRLCRAETGRLALAFTISEVAEHAMSDIHSQ